MGNIAKKIKFFFNVLAKSLTKFSYYKEIAKTDFKFSLKYLFFLFYITSLISSFFLALSLSIFVLPKVPQIVYYINSKAKNLYPDGLVVEVDKGKVSTNQKEPYYIDTPKEFGIFKGFDHIITINTRSEASDIKKFNTLVLITKDSVVSAKTDNSYEVRQIDKETNITIDQKSYNGLIDQIIPYLKYLKPAVIALIVLSVLLWPLISSALSLIGELLYLLIFTAVFFILVKLLKKKLSFKKLFQLEMHAASLPILIGILASSLGIHVPFLLGSAILFVFMILVINEF